MNQINQINQMNQINHMIHMKNYSDVNIFLETLMVARQNLLNEVNISEEWKMMELNIIHQQLYDLAQKNEKKINEQNKLHLQQIFYCLL